MALKPLTHGFDAYQEHAKPAEVPEEVQLPMLLASAPVAPAAPASPTSPAGDVPQAAQEKTPAEKTSQSYAEEMEPGSLAGITVNALNLR
ncbi:unnamed protein product [Cladocopium goreaui]|uniref:Uncharacterized protein n=1 Tax=Cladocopium goreaui TaxID=2562237 RepID=A0A9P1DDQ7_9DINO|nr:unnamed protein product [Cladocopium goreaui]